MDNEFQKQYQELIVSLYKSPLHKKQIQDATVMQDAKNPSCGDSLTLSLQIEGNTVKNAGYIGDGCAISIAAASLLTDEIICKELEIVKEISEDDVIAMLGIPISYSRKKCALLCYSALLDALKK